MAEKDAQSPVPVAQAPQRAEPSAVVPSGTAPARDRPETVIAPYWPPNMLAYGDVSRMLFRMHRNVAAHMEAQKRLAERMQAVFAHEQAMVLELARLIDESMAVAARGSNEDKPPLASKSIDRIFEHAGQAMTETGRMLSEMQLESLALLRHYIEQSGEINAPPPQSPQKSERKKGAGKE